MIHEEIEKELFAYTVKIIQEMDSKCLVLNGTMNHVHLLISLSKSSTLSKLVELIKKRSSKWIKTKGVKFQNFYWQNGYGAFSIGESNVENLIKYINNQKEHHKKRTFREEFIEFLKKYNIEYDERYIWE